LRIPVVCFVGRKNSGKTTLMAKVIAGLKAAGHRVAAVKHDAHRFEIDYPGKDSFRFTAAGADITVISSREKTAVVLRHREEIPLEAILSRFVEGVDIILAEGYKASRFPKIEVHRKATGELLLHPHPRGLIAVVTDERVDTAVPQLDSHDSERLVEFIQKKYLGAKGRSRVGG
jgi:molybdopterin-guanine dinucleotide biosynthesis protein MobB